MNLDRVWAACRNMHHRAIDEVGFGKVGPLIVDQAIDISFLNFCLLIFRNDRDRREAVLVALINAIRDRLRKFRARNSN